MPEWLNTIYWNSSLWKFGCCVENCHSWRAWRLALQNRGKNRNPFRWRRKNHSRVAKKHFDSRKSAHLGEKWRIANPWFVWQKWKHVPTKLSFDASGNHDRFDHDGFANFALFNWLRTPMCRTNLLALICHNHRRTNHFDPSENPIRTRKMAQKRNSDAFDFAGWNLAKSTDERNSLVVWNGISWGKTTKNGGTFRRREFEKENTRKLGTIGRHAKSWWWFSVVWRWQKCWIYFPLHCYWFGADETTRCKN